MFSGRDASLAFVTGEFTEEALTDDISSLTASQSKAISTWVTFYEENYIYKGNCIFWMSITTLLMVIVKIFFIFVLSLKISGKLIGRYYNADGEPTEEYEKFAAKVKAAEEERSKEDEKMRMFPPCNAEWKPDVGTRFWCTKQRLLLSLKDPRKRKS